MSSQIEYVAMEKQFFDTLDPTIVDSLLKYNAKPNLGHGGKISLIATITTNLINLKPSNGVAESSHLTQDETNLY